MYRKLFIRAVAVVAVALIAVAEASAGGQEEAAGKGPVTIGSKIDTEGALLGNMMVLLLRDAGFEVNDRTEFGTTDVVRKAIISGEIDMYPEYTGNGGFLFDQSDSQVWKDAEAAYQTVKQLDLEENDIVWLQPAPANNTWAIAVRKDLAEAEDLASLEDLADYVNEGGTLKLAGSEEFVSRPDALPAFQKAYGFELSSDQLLVVSSGNTAQTEQAAANRTDGVNAAMAYGTDGAIAALDLVVLDDTKGVQPVYQPAPIIRQEVIDEFPEIRDILTPVFQTLDLETLQELNGQIVVEGLVAQDVARSYLTENGYID